MANPLEGGKSVDFRVSKRAHKFYQSFCSKGQVIGESYPLFKKYTNLFTLCAAIGYSLGSDKKTPLQDKIETPFTLEQVDEKTEWPLLIAIAWADSNKDINIFTDSKKIIKICEEYAETGFQFLIKKYPFDFTFIDNNLENYENADLEFHVSLLIKQLKDQFLEEVV